MVTQNVGLLVVCGAEDGPRLAGVISERDILKPIASGRGINIPVNGISTKRVLPVKIDPDVAEAARAKNKNRIRHIVVANGHEEPIHVISMRDLVGERATLTAILQSHEKEVFVVADQSPK